MSEGSISTTRLSKAAKEFNIATSTIVDFLSKKGHHIDSNPNTKLSPEMYSMLLHEFQAEKQVKEESKKIGIEYSDRKTISATDAVAAQSDDYEEDEIDTTELIIKNVTGGFKSHAADKPKPASKPKEDQQAEHTAKTEKSSDQETPLATEKADAPQEAPLENKNVQSTAGAEIEKPNPVDYQEQTTEALSTKQLESEPPLEEEAGKGQTKNEVSEKPAGHKGNEQELTILGKIDLNSLNQRTKPDKKSKAQRIKDAENRKNSEKESKALKEGTQKQDVKQEVSPEKPTASPAHKPDNDEPQVPAQEKAKNFIPTQIRKLEGPKILDKIELPSERKPKQKPVASSTEDKVSAMQKKKKRKRIKPKPGEATATPGSKPPTTVGKEPLKRDKPSSRRDEKNELSEEDIQKQIKETLARLSPLGKSKASKHRRHKRDIASSTMHEEMERMEHDKTKLKVTEFVTANELATMMNVPVNKVIAACMSLGMFVSINQRLDAEMLSVVAEEFGFEVEFVSAELQDTLAGYDDEANPEDIVERAPIVTVMGHVDHGKTLLLDYIRKSNVVAGEAGGITQHIGAYEVYRDNGKKITFLDTPGHEAFTAMRARGAKITDVAIIVIAADDEVMPQTKEAINHAQAAGVPIVFAFNKIDKPTANADRLREQLANMNILVEDWGGKFQCQEVSAKSGKGIDDLLEKVLLESEILDLKGNPKIRAKGTIIESSLDKGRGYVAKLLVQDGTLHGGDIVLAGSTFGKVKAMFNERNQSIKEAGPSTPLLLLGLNGAPQAGDSFNVMHDEKEAKNLAVKRQQLQREQGLRTQKHMTLDEIGRRIAIGDFKELNLIVKGDVDGSVEALSDSLLKLSTSEIQINVIHKSVGAITESDVLLASASNAIIVGFQVRPSLQARKLAENEEIDIRLYSIIYQAIEEIKSAMEGMLAPKIEEVITCNIEIREVFKITKVGAVAGCMVLDGKVNRNTKIRLIRDGIVIYGGSLGSLKRFKDDVKEVSAGYECGLNIEGFNDIKVGDIIEGYQEKEVSRKL
jgi:translation initiation factor IF-2